ncbi:protein of unknown function [Methylacidimicrobium sp. AP8]|nr:protein of unknown function [Methylacidimicrobium sp. AP8]
MLDLDFPGRPAIREAFLRYGGIPVDALPMFLLGGREPIRSRARTEGGRGHGKLLTSISKLRRSLEQGNNRRGPSDQQGNRFPREPSRKAGSSRPGPENKDSWNRAATGNLGSYPAG